MFLLRTGESLDLQIDALKLKTFLYIANACKKQRFTVNAVHLLYKLAESHNMAGTN